MTRAKKSVGAGATKRRERREPVQSRSRDRLEAILDCAAALVDEIGPEHVTTTLIAERLQVSVGSIYSYFPDRLAIFDEIVSRSIGDLDAAVAVARSNALDRGASFIEVSWAVIDAAAEGYRDTPGFQKLWFSQFLSTSMLIRMRRSDEDQAQFALDRACTEGLRVDHPNPMTVMRLYIGIIDKGLDLAFRFDPEGDPTLIAELKRAVDVYLRSSLVPLAAPTPGHRAITPPAG